LSSRRGSLRPASCSTRPTRASTGTAPTGSLAARARRSVVGRRSRRHLATRSSRRIAPPGGWAATWSSCVMTPTHAQVSGRFLFPRWLVRRLLATWLLISSLTALSGIDTSADVWCHGQLISLYRLWPQDILYNGTSRAQRQMMTRWLPGLRENSAGARGGLVHNSTHTMPWRPPPMGSYNYEPLLRTIAKACYASQTPFQIRVQGQCCPPTSGSPELLKAQEGFCRNPTRQSCRSGTEGGGDSDFL
jgi:hypothetical protein